MSFFSKWLSSVSIRYAIPGLLAILIITAIGVTGWLAFQSGQRAVDDLATRLSQEVTVRIEEHVLNFIEIPQLFHDINVATVKAGNLNLENYEDLGRTFWNQVYISDAVPYLYMGTETGDFLGVDSNFGSGEAVFKLRNEASSPERVTYTLDGDGNMGEEVARSEYDPRIRPWYQSAATAGKATWSPIYVFSAKPILGISPAVPVYDEQNNLFGVLGIDLTLSELTEFLRGLNISPSGEAVIIERDGNLVATSGQKEPFVTTSDGEQDRLNLTDSTEPLFEATSEALLDRFGTFENIGPHEEFNFPFQGDRVYVEVSRLQDDRGLDWLTVVMIPSQDFTEPVYDNLRQTILLGMLVLVAAAALGYVLARWIIQPLFALTDVAAKIEEGDYDLTHLEPVAVRTDELGQLARVFQHMAEQVYSREQQLKQQVQQLRIEIDEVKRKEQVSQIVESDFFMDLQAKARDIRGRHRREAQENDSEVSGSD